MLVQSLLLLLFQYTYMDICDCMFHSFSVSRGMNQGLQVIFYLPIPHLPSIFLSIVNCRSLYFQLRLICAKQAVFFDSTEYIALSQSCCPWYLQNSAIQRHLESLKLVDTAYLQGPTFYTIEKHRPDITFYESYPQVNIKI